MDVTAYWCRLMHRPETEIPLDEAALLISLHANPELDMGLQLRRLDDLAEQIGSGSIRDVCGMLFEKLGLHGDERTYSDPRNSYLDRVLDRRRGIPISLSVLLMEIGRRCGLVLEGVGMPGHFLVRDTASPELLIDAFVGGRRLDHAACEQLLRATMRAPVTLEEGMLAASGTRAIMARMLANLDHSFRQRNDRRSLVWVTRLRLGIPGLPMATRIELASSLAELGCYHEAADLFEELASSSDISEETSEHLTAKAERTRAHLN